jgi:hypothetical protein
LISEPFNEKEMKNTDNVRVATLDTSEDDISNTHDFVAALVRTCNSTCICVGPLPDDSGLSVDCIGSLDLLAPLAFRSASNDILIDFCFVSHSDQMRLFVLLQLQVSIKI